MSAAEFAKKVEGIEERLAALQATVDALTAPDRQLHCGRLIVGDGDHHVIIEATDTAASVAVYGPSSAHGSTCAEVYATTDDDDTDAGLAVFVEGNVTASVHADEHGATVWAEGAT